MTFRFPLAPVLRLKESIEKQEEMALQRILVEISQIQQQLDMLTADIEQARELLDQGMQEMLPAVHVESMTNQIENAIRRRQELLASIAKLLEKRDVQNRKYHTAHNSRKMLSDMQARQMEAYLQERARAEQKLVDDVFARHTRRT